MATPLTVSVVGADVFARALGALRAPEQAIPVGRALKVVAFAVQTRATENEIIRSGVRGRGKNRTDAPPAPDRVTSRKGKLRESIGIDFADTPRSVSVGSAISYSVVHERGGAVRVKSHKRTLGKTRVRVRGYTATYPQRPFIAPALANVEPRMPAIFSDELEKHVAKKAKR